jgi:hypothetical protein
MVKAVETCVHGASTFCQQCLDERFKGSNKAIESKVSLVKSSVTFILSFEPNLAHLMTSCEAMSCISSNMDLIDKGPNAAQVSDSFCPFQASFNVYTHPA